MRTESEVKKRYAQVIWKYLKLRLTKELSPKLENCIFSRPRHRTTGPARVYCAYGCTEEASMNLCVYAGREHECPGFQLRKTKEQVRAEFQSDLKRPLFKHHNMKDLVQLEWVLGLSEELAGEYESEFLEEFLSFLERKQLKKLGWRARLKRWWVSCRIVGQVKSLDPGLGSPSKGVDNDGSGVDSAGAVPACSESEDQK